MKNKHLLRVGALFVTTAALCSCDINKSGQYAFMFKLTGNHYGQVLFSGFDEYMTSINEKHFEKTPADANVGDQIQMIETLILQNVKAITVSAAGTTGYDNVLKQAKDKGIKVVSVDSPISPTHRVTHIDHVKAVDAGQWLARASILIAHRIPYPVQWLKDNPTKSLADYITSEDGGKKILEAKTKEAGYKKKKFGYISSTQDSPSQNEWMMYCTQELKNADYANYVDTSKEFEIKYGNDEPGKSTEMANSFIDQKTVDVVIAPTSVAMAAAGEALNSRKSEHNMKLTGLGMPSEMWNYMPKNKDGSDEFEVVCPYMCLWDVKKFGSIAGAASLAAVNGTFDGSIGSKFTYTYEEDGKTITEEHEAVKSDDGGTKVVALKPLAFNWENIDHYKDII